ncbi:ATP-binding protein [Pseudoclavibacter soli]|uniref:ATP-binding protein n=1 Tax=Pseudoclavibacter soli TaxID=452623 RepID=UPI000407FE91|nr:SbcC/MukB-like Walker B domain-containing protein [Pseudoclavibacter soli]
MSTDTPLFTDPALVEHTQDPVSATLGQWRLSEVQLVNWGTFQGFTTLPVARRGHLFTGPSGSGKSSLLDGIATVLTPVTSLRFNLAAQGSRDRDDQRSLISYVRGAWSRTTDDTQDRIVSAYLRPDTTWSAVALRFDDGQGASITLARLFFLTGTGTAASDLKQQYLICRDALDLHEIAPAAEQNLDLRAMKRLVPGLDSYKPGEYFARLRTLFGIEQENALRLLHRTQSAKNLDSLDQLFRDYMLDIPSTFDRADEAVQQFTELDASYQAVVQLRLQRDHLVLLRGQSEVYDAAEAGIHRLTALEAALPAYQRRLQLDLLETQRQALVPEIARLQGETTALQGRVSAADELVAATTRRAAELGDGDLQQLQHRIDEATQRLQQVEQRRQVLQRQLGEVGISTVPATAEEFAELRETITRELAELDGSTADGGAADRTYDVFDAASRAIRDHKEVLHQIEMLKSEQSTMPTQLLEVRRLLAEHLSTTPRALPFAAELLEVRDEHAPWTGAIERVLRPLSLTLLVRDEHLAQVRTWVDGHHLGTRLVYQAVPTTAPEPRPVSDERSLVARVRVADGPFAQWLRWRLGEAYDFTCVDSPAELGDHARAMTITGQQHSGHGRYEKNDRLRVDDRLQWVLGDRRRKLDLLLERAAELRERRRVAELTRNAAQQAIEHRARRAGTLSTLRDLRFDDHDLASAESTVAHLHQQYDERVRPDSQLAEAVQRRRSAELDRDRLRAHHADTLAKLSTARHDLDGVEQRIARLARAAASAEADGSDTQTGGGVPDEATVAELHRRFHARQRRLDADQVADTGAQIARQLRGEIDAEQSTAAKAAERIVALESEFRQRWPDAAADLTVTVEDRAGYLNRLDDIIARGLPEHERDFLELLHQRSTELMGFLRDEIRSAPDEIRLRVDPVNEALAHSEFDHDRHLRIRVKPRRTQAAADFLTDLDEVLGQSWVDDTMELAEHRFAKLAGLIRRFASSEHIDRVWRTQCLDTRQHVSFLAEEVDAAGQAQATYDSGGAMSGGQQQKLAIFALAAALRYQLSGADGALPSYGTVVLDEAFDKADSSYTRMALDVFQTFGFHMVLATPNKLVTTIEPYIGGATVLANPTRQQTVFSELTWEHDAQSE